jgi:hypothetical protein
LPSGTLLRKGLWPALDGAANIGAFSDSDELDVGPCVEGGPAAGAWHNAGSENVAISTPEHTAIPPLNCALFQADFIVLRIARIGQARSSKYLWIHLPTI